jgi:alpha-ketoglutarate-dependent taurine dioxygenase
MAEEGGENLFVDAFSAAQELYQIDRKAFELLSRFIVPHQYLEGSRYHLFVDIYPTIQLDSRGLIHQIR